ncbi:transcriptional regulator [Salinivibrio sp. VYel6]|uniref:transcriptional regulator n=1 Tax=Salinivibrio sp. VYel6 TaxID=2490493 RepID=UPI00128B8649|nr:YdaS family helix-turn-helix protein [Salinivibrio sp. VYel6]MPX98194.1 transcriptional regulator [Salinivibrio sp. VYel6]
MFVDYWKNLSPKEKEALAKKVGTKVSYLRHVAAGTHKAGPKLCLKLEQATDGEITKQDLRPDYYPSADAA